MDAWTALQLFENEQEGCNVSEEESSISGDSFEDSEEDQEIPENVEPALRDSVFAEVVSIH